MYTRTGTWKSWNDLCYHFEKCKMNANVKYCSGSSSYTFKNSFTRESLSEFYMNSNKSWYDVEISDYKAVSSWTFTYIVHVHAYHKSNPIKFLWELLNHLHSMLKFGSWLFGAIIAANIRPITPYKAQRSFKSTLFRRCSSEIGG